MDCRSYEGNGCFVEAALRGRPSFGFDAVAATEDRPYSKCGMS